MLKVGIIGCGGIAQVHAEGWLKAADLATVTALCDISEENIARLSEKWGDEPWKFDNWNDLLRVADVDAVDLCLPPHLHKPAVVAAAQAGKHILCEIPLCRTLEEAAEIEAAVRAHGVTLMCAHQQIFTPAIQHARQFLDRGELGPIWQARTGDCCRTDWSGREEVGWRADRDRAGGGALMDTGYHPSYLLLYLVRQQVAQVTALTGRYHLPFLDGEDSATVLVRFESGTVGQIYTSWAWEWPEGFPQFHLIGEKGQIFGRGTHFTFKPVGASPRVTRLPSVSSFHAEIRHFAECLRNGTRPVQDHTDGIAVLKVILGAYTSEEQGRRIEL